MFSFAVNEEAKYFFIKLRRRVMERHLISRQPGLGPLLYDEILWSITDGL